VTLLDLQREWIVDKEKFASKGRNTPFHGWKLRGRAVRTIVGGRTAWNLDA
jgi:dihydroorotase